MVLSGEFADFVAHPSIPDRNLRHKVGQFRGHLFPKVHKAQAGIAPYLYPCVDPAIDCSEQTRQEAFLPGRTAAV